MTSTATRHHIYLPFTKSSERNGPRFTILTVKITTSIEPCRSPPVTNIIIVALIRVFGAPATGFVRQKEFVVLNARTFWVNGRREMSHQSKNVGEEQHDGWFLGLELYRWRWYPARWGIWADQERLLNNDCQRCWLKNRWADGRWLCFGIFVYIEVWKSFI